ncbi:MAG: hypothetical protein JJE34_09395 [Alphaproteobacteria bacterium]|nr:hypothetical protein [Alphaproteobacteria bacterium]
MRVIVWDWILPAIFALTLALLLGLAPSANLGEMLGLFGLLMLGIASRGLLRHLIRHQIRWQKDRDMSLLRFLLRKLNAAAAIRKMSEK